MAFVGRMALPSRSPVNGENLSKRKTRFAGLVGVRSCLYLVYSIRVRSVCINV